MIKGVTRKVPDDIAAEEMRLFQDAADRGRRYLQQIRSRRVFPSESSLGALENLPRKLGFESMPGSEIISILDQVGSPATVALAGGRYFGFVCGGTLPTARAAGVLACAWDQNAAMRVLSPVAAELEEIALAWIIDLLGLPDESGGAFVTGATMASLTCLAAARHQLLARSGWDVESDGLFGAPEVPVFVSANVHASVLKSLALLGFGRSRLSRLPTDSQGRIITSDLPAIEPGALVCIQAGDVNSGAFDDATALCSWAHAAAGWVHVDGAFGLWAAASSKLRHLTRGMETADSWATDAHKWLNAPYDCGVAVVKERASLRSAMSMQAAYLKPSEERRDPSHWNPELSRRARGVETWAALLSLGRDELAKMLERTCTHATAFARGLSEAGFEVLNDVVLNQVLVSFGSDEFTEAVTQAIQADGVCWCGTSLWKGRRVMRISVSSWATTEEDVELSLSSMRRAAQGCRVRA